MPRISLDISELFNSEDSEGHLLAEFLQRRRGIVPSGNFILYQPRENRISLDVQVEDASPSQLVHDDNNAENVESHMARLFGNADPDLNIAEDLPCSIKEFPPENLPTSNVAAPEPASGSAIPNDSKLRSDLPNNKIMVLRKSCSKMSPSDRLRRLSLRKFSNQRPGRRILLEELNKLDETEKISSDLDFNPGTCSTPFVVSPKSPLSPLKDAPESASCQTLKSSDFREIQRIDENLNAILKESINSESNKTNVIQVHGTFNLPEPTQPHVIENGGIEKENVHVTKSELWSRVVGVRETLAPQEGGTTISDANVDVCVVQNSLDNNVESPSNRNVQEKPKSPSPDDNANHQSKASPLPTNNDLVRSEDGNNETGQDLADKNKTLAPDSNAEVHNLPERTISVTTVSNERALHYLHGKPQPMQVVAPPLLSPVHSTNHLSKSPTLHNNDPIPCEEDRTDLVRTSLKPQRSSQGPLNLVNRRSTRGKRGRLQQIPHVTASSSSDSNTEMDHASPPTAHNHMPKLNGTRRRIKRKRKATLNKPPGVPLNGELYAKELARLTNNEILDLRKRNSMGEIFTSNVLTRNSIEVEDLRKQKQQELEERIKSELEKRRLSTENGRISSHQQIQPTDVRDDSKVLVKDVFTESRELHNQQEQISFRKSRPKKKQMSEALQHYMEIPQRIMARKQSTNHSKRSLYTQNDFERTFVETPCTAQGVNDVITNNTEKCTQSPTPVEEMPPPLIITPPAPFRYEETERPITPLLAPPVQFVSSPRKHKLPEEAETANELFKKPTSAPPKRGRRRKENNSNTTTDSSSNSTSTLRRSSRQPVPNKKVQFVQHLYQRCFEKTLKNHENYCRNVSRSITPSTAFSTASVSTPSSPPPISTDNKRSKKQSNTSSKLTTAETSKKMSQKSRQLSPATAEESEETTASKKLTVAETSKQPLQKSRQLSPSSESEDLTKPSTSSTSVKQRPRRGRKKKETQTTSLSTQVNSEKINKAPIEKPKRRKKELQFVEQIEPVRETSPGTEQDNDKPKKKKKNARTTKNKSKKEKSNEQMSLLTPPPMPPLESSLTQPGTSKELIHTDLDYSHVPLPRPPPVQHLNNVFDRLRTVGTLSIQPDSVPSTSQSHQSTKDQSSLTVKNSRCRELRVNVKKLKNPVPGNGSHNKNNNNNNDNNSDSSCSQQQFPDSSMSSNVELISWLKSVKETEYYGPNNEIFREMRISSHANLCFTKLQGVEYAFYDTDETASLGYLRFKPRQIKQKKKTKYFHLHFITIVGTFRVTASDREKILTPGDMVAIEKLVLYEIENITDDIGILMVIKK